jgi:hypothetical protein
MSNGCIGTSATPIAVTVNPLPIPVIIQTGNDLSTTTTYDTYQWYNAAGSITGATGQIYTPTANDDYYVVVTDANGCSGQSNMLPITLGLSGVISKANAITLFPNPNNGYFTINGLININDNELNVRVVDVMGRIVYEEARVMDNGTSLRSFELKVLVPAGLYILELHTGSECSLIPFVKE